jgi:Ca2+-binding EF-hand superfamily protein
MVVGLAAAAPARPAGALSELSPDAVTLLKSFVSLLGDKNVPLSDFHWKLDHKWTGTLTSDQLASGMKQLGASFSDSAFSALFKWLDQDHNELVDFFELSSAAALGSEQKAPPAYLTQLTKEQIEQLSQVFKQMDKDRSGKIDDGELFKVRPAADNICTTHVAPCARTALGAHRSFSTPRKFRIGSAWHGAHSWLSSSLCRSG